MFYIKDRHGAEEREDLACVSLVSIVLVGILDHSSSSLLKGRNFGSGLLKGQAQREAPFKESLGMQMTLRLLRDVAPALWVEAHGSLPKLLRVYIGGNKIHYGLARECIQLGI